MRKDAHLKLQTQTIGAGCTGSVRSGFALGQRSWQGGWRSWTRACVLAGATLIATRLFAQGAPVAPPTDAVAAPAADQDAVKPAPHTPPAFMRVKEVKDKSVELQIAARDYVHSEGKGPRVGLVGVAHIGERTFYRDLEKLLSGYEVVLYESVKPSGASRPGGDTEQQRIDSTRASMRFVRGLLKTYLDANQALPANLEALREFAAKHDARLGHFLSDASVDAWGNALQYGLIAGAEDAANAYHLVSLGADGKPGGEGENADISLKNEPAPEVMALSDDDGLQAQLADALGMEFQLEVMDYGKPNWRCSDMDMDQLNRALSERGLNFEMLGGTLAGSSMPARVIKLLLGVIKMADSFMSGAITDTFKVVMIEMLGDVALTDASLKQLGAGFAEVIIVDRNNVTMADLKAIIDTEPEVGSVAIFYGAGHMADFDEQLRAMGYVPADDGERWLTGMKVDLEKSAVSARELNQIRAMMRQAIRQQFRQN